jgi:hypothetical protein
LLVSILLLIQAGAWLWELQVSAMQVCKTNQTLKLPQKRKAAVVVPSAFDWDSVPENDLKLLSGHFGSTRSPTSFKVSFVPSGEPIIADVYE